MDCKIGNGLTRSKDGADIAKTIACFQILTWKPVNVVQIAEFLRLDLVIQDNLVISHIGQSSSRFQTEHFTVTGLWIGGLLASKTVFSI